MVKLKGPMSSAEASGSLGQAATFSSWKGRAYARAKTVPTNPKSDLQTSVRAMLGFLAQRWTELTVPQKATWETLAAATNVPPYNAFLSTNLERWGRFKSPGRIYPIPGTGLAPTADFVSAVGGSAHAKLTFLIDNDRDVWGLAIFRGTATPLVTAKNNCIVILMHQAEEQFTYLDQALHPGIYYYNCRYFSTNGNLHVNETQRTATVT